MGRTKHGMRKSPEYTAWISMKQRCTNPNVKSYKDYGERNIVVCDEWKESFMAFYNDMGARPDGGTLERLKKRS